MNGPEHYREAERLLTEHEYETSADALAAAQVHATLALAAATAASRYTDRDPNGFFESTSIEDVDQWVEAVAPTTKETP